MDLEAERNHIRRLLSAAEKFNSLLVTILPNNVAYLKRGIEEAISRIAERSAGQVAREEDARPNGNVPNAAHGSEVKAKYRDPKTGETWSGRGRMATWLKRKQDAGEEIDDYLV